MISTRICQVNNQYYGIYFSDTYSITDKLALTAAGRLNVAHIDLDDRDGSNLNGSHDYWRFNPSLGLPTQVVPAVNLYGSYSKANRTPTAAELACSNPDQPCRVPNAFTSDPSLDQVVSRTFEIGARGKLGRHQEGGDLFERPPTLDWSLAA